MDRGRTTAVSGSRPGAATGFTSLEEQSLERLSPNVLLPVQRIVVPDVSGSNLKAFDYG
jgi:hypothetical protein